MLSRKENQSIIIDGHIKVTIVQIAKSQVRVGIEAPDGVRILRAEVLEKHRTPVEEIG